MSVVIVIKAVEGDVTTSPELKGAAKSTIYLKSYDPEAFDGRGDLVATHDIAEAQRFADNAAAWDCYRQQSQTRPWRADGEANRPACAFSISIIPAPEST